MDPGTGSFQVFNISSIFLRVLSLTEAYESMNVEYRFLPKNKV